MQNLENLSKNKGGRPKETPSIQGRNFFLTIPHFEGSVKEVIETLKMNQPQWQYLKYAAVKQTHTKDAAKAVHLHLYVSFPKKRLIKLDRFDYLGKHGKLERVRDYSSVITYMTKENRPQCNFDYIEVVMRKDFPKAVQILLSQGLHIREIYTKYSSIVASKNWSGYLRLLSFHKDSEKIILQLEKPGLRMITPELIKARLSDQELSLYYSSDIYGRIIDKVNDIVRYGCHRPHKAKALFLTGRPGTGKTTFGLALARKVATFTFPDDGWFAGYQSDIFKMIQWEQFDISAFRYPKLLKFLQGLRMNLPIKGSHVNRSDNPLIYLTSNLTLQELICSRFSSKENRDKSRLNLGARIEEINLGDKPIFFLLKLLVSPIEDI
jgi:SpoVK/Ycf46/Vps4 family AAA+-type ATPase